MTIDIRARIAEIEAQHKQKVVAVVLNADGTVYDHCFTWETGQNYALSEGYRVVAIADDHSMTIDRQQALYDSDRAAYNDCFGITS